jgi:hypothetical protein
MIPMDLAGSGCVVVTNTFKTKTDEYLKGLSGNIIPASPGLDEIVAALELAKSRSQNLEERYKFAKAMKYPRDWDQSLTSKHLNFFKRRLRVRAAKETVVDKQKPS